MPNNWEFFTVINKFGKILDKNSDDSLGEIIRFTDNGF